MQSIVRIMKILGTAAQGTARDVYMELRQIGSVRKIQGHDKVQLGAGPNPLPGWANLDLAGDNIHWDLTRPLPIKENTIRLLYSEHFIEHVTRQEALSILRNCRAALKSGGIIRISTPDLRKLASDYLRGTVIAMPHGSWFPKTPCQMLNEGMRLWGHQYVYDEPELRDLLEEAGFCGIRRVVRSESEHSELRGLETRPDFGDLIVEAMASGPPGGAVAR